MSQSRNALIYSSGLILSAIVGIGLSLSAPKPLRILPLAATIALSSGAAYCAQKGIRPAEIEEMDRAAELACLEAERENALEEIQESDDIERELSTYERRLNIEAEAMRRTFPAKIEMQKMQQLLYPQQQIVINPSNATPAPEQPGLNPVEVFAPVTSDGLFDWNSLKDADKHPILGLIAKMGGGKSLLAKYLGKHILEGSVTVFDIYGNHKEWQGCDVLFDYEEMILRMTDDNEAIDNDVAAYRNGKRDFNPQLMVLEEGKSTLKRLQKLRLSKESIEQLTELGRITKPGAIVEEWKMNYESLTRKIRRRLCLVSTNMNASVLGINAETRDEITIIFTGTSGIGKAMKDTSMLKLGAKQNQTLRAQLLDKLKGIEYPALVYHDNEWFAAKVPKLDDNGNPAGTTPQVTMPPVVPPPIQPPSIADNLNKLLNLEVEDEDSDR